MAYTYDFPRPGLTADCVVFGLGGDCVLNVLLIQRKRHPFEGSWAIPGGFVNEGEDLHEAARRELLEETGLCDLPLNQFHAFGKPGRDPRGWTVTVAYWAIVRADHVRLRAGDDAARAAWFPLADLPPLAFDHKEMLEKALAALRTAAAHPETWSTLVPPGISPEMSRLL